MTQNYLRPLASTLTVLVAVGALCMASSALAGHGHRNHCKCCQPYGDNYRPDLFYNYYVGGDCDLPAKMYVAPLPVPPHVGHTWVTYQPLMPHELLYAHQRTYHRYYDGGRGLNRTCVKWGHSPIPDTLHGLRELIRVPR